MRRSAWPGTRTASRAGGGHRDAARHATGRRRCAARLLAADDGPRIAALAFDGWDTHVNEGGATGRLAQLLGGLDLAVAALETGLGAHWRDTVVVAVTEFGRTVHINGTVGTDHGTGTVAFLAGGGVRGGTVLADWPGLCTCQSLRRPRPQARPRIFAAILKGVLAEHWGLSGAVLADSVFPGSGAVKPITGLFA